VARWNGLHGRFEVAKKLLGECFLREGPDYMPGLALQQRLAAWYGDQEWIRDAIRRIDANSNPVSRLLAGYGRFFLGEQTKEELIGPLERIITVGAHPRFASVLCQNAAEVLAVRGHLEDAMTFLNRAADGVLVDLDWLEHCKALEPLRSMPEFAAARLKVRMRAEAIWSA
jgi:eukaryotic-like serine/threonine-protein kinase